MERRSLKKIKASTDGIRTRDLRDTVFIDSQCLIFLATMGIIGSQCHICKVQSNVLLIFYFFCGINVVVVVVIVVVTGAMLYQLGYMRERGQFIVF